MHLIRMIHFAVVASMPGPVGFSATCLLVAPRAAGQQLTDAFTVCITCPSLRPALNRPTEPPRCDIRAAQILAGRYVDWRVLRRRHTAWSSECHDMYLTPDPVIASLYRFTHRAGPGPVKSLSAWKLYQKATLVK